MPQYLKVWQHVLLFKFQQNLGGVLLFIVFVPQAMVDMAANEGWLATTLRLMHLVQMCVQGRWILDSSVLSLPHVGEEYLAMFNQALARSQQSLGQRGREGRRGGEGKGSKIPAGVQEVGCIQPYMAELLAVYESENKFLSHALGKSQSGQQITQVEWCKLLLHTV